MTALAEAVRRHWPSYVAAHGPRIPLAHRRAAQAILRCRTVDAGLVFYRCDDCGRIDASPVSCGHRACNACGQHKAAEWEARQKARLLPLPYHMATFTIPQEFRELFRCHQKFCYDLFFRESAGALTDLAADPRHLGGEIGMTGVLQTWTRDLRYHPHIHYLLPAGALTDTGWVRPKNPAVLVPAIPLAVRMRNRMREALKEADFKLYCTVKAKAWKHPWNVDVRPVGRGDTAFGYLARYIQKTALDAARILEVTNTHVTIAWTDRESGKRRTGKLTGHEFLRRFLQHVLPKGFVRCRHFGFLSAAARTRFARVRALLRAAEVTLVLPPKQVIPCPCCGNPMTFLRCDRARGPPLRPP